MSKKLKLLLIMRDFSKWGNPKQYFLGQELAKITDLVIWHKEGNIHDIINKISFKPDFILLMHYKSKTHMYPPISGLSTLEIPFGVFIRDLHSLKEFQKHIMRDNVQHIFSCFRDSFYERFPELTDRMIWLPNHVHLPVFKDYGLKKEIDMLMMGNAYKSYYPLRSKIRSHFKKHPSFTYHYPPRHRLMTPNNKSIVREDYAKEINRSKIFFTCGSKLDYPIMKYFEVLACHTLLLASNFKELYDLGFRDGENFVAINENNFQEKAEFYLKNKEERHRITKNGYDFVHQRHSTEQRAKELVQHIEKIIGR